ncbi:MAG TPA: hypothetical protein VJR92_13810, partial [Gemmatimonadaceae bacterium]|nr:hypothetical protein [Gemmatimonadaceae bacterium]
MSMRFALVAASATVLALPAAAQSGRGVGCDADNAGLTLPAGFCAGVFARGVPAARHIAVASNGDVFVISNRGGRGGGTGPARGVYRLRDANNDGKADSAERVADGIGTGISIAHGALYAEAGGTGGMIVRYPFREGSTDLSGAVDTIVSGLTPGGSHFQRNFAIRGDELFVNIGSAGNICQTGGRGQPPGPPPDPCPELDTRAGIWKFSATQKNQTFSSANRFVKGFR